MIKYSWHHSYTLVEQMKQNTEGKYRKQTELDQQ